MSITVETFIETQQGLTDLNLVAGREGQYRVLFEPGMHAAPLLGYLNPLRPERISIFGPREITYYNHLSDSGRAELHETLLQAQPPALIISNALPPPPALMAFCDSNDLPLLCSALASGPLIDSLGVALTRKANDHGSVHGVLMDVLGMGVLISGDSGLGKSELAMELISRGHGLVADDVVDIERVNPHTIIGRCPALLQGLLEVRGLGLIDIRTIFGESAVRRHMSIKLIVHLVKRSTLENEYERLPLESLTETLLGVPIRKVAIPVAAGRNIAVLTETAVRSTILLLRGIDTTRDFAKRQQAAILAGIDAESPPAPRPAQPPEQDEEDE